MSIVIVGLRLILSDGKASVKYRMTVHRKLMLEEIAYDVPSLSVRKALDSRKTAWGLLSKR